MDEYDDLLARVRAGERPKAQTLTDRFANNDEYGALLARVRGQKTQPSALSGLVSAAVWGGSFVNQGKEVEKQRLALDMKKELGEDWSPKLIDPDDARRRLLVSQMDHAVMRSPTLQRMVLEEPDYIGLVGKEAKRLADIDESIATMVKNFPGAVASGLALRPFEGAYGLLAAPFDLAHQAAQVVGLERDGTQSPVGRWLRNRGADVGAAANWLGTLHGNPAGLASAGVRSGGESLGSSLAAIGMGLLTRNPASVSAGLLSLMTAGKSYLEGMEHTKSPLRSALHGAEDATAEYVTERFWGMKQLFEIPGLKYGIKEFLKGVGNFAFREMVGEQIATVWQDFNAWANLNPDKMLDDFIAERGDAAALTAIATVVGGGGQVALMQAVKARGLAEQKRLFDALHSGARDSELRAALPEKYRAFVEQATKNGPAENVYIPADQFTIYFQDAGIDPAQAAADLNAINYPEAAELGTDVIVPMADFATLIAGTDHYVGLQEHLRLNPGMETAYEARLADANREASDAEVEAALARARADLVANDTALSIKDLIVGQLIGRYTRDTAEDMATLFAAGISNIARLANVSPESLMEKYGLRIETPIPEVLRRISDAQLDVDPLIDMIRARRGANDAQTPEQSLLPNEDPATTDRLRMADQLENEIETAGIDLAQVTDNAEVRRLLLMSRPSNRAIEQLGANAVSNDSAPGQSGVAVLKQGKRGYLRIGPDRQMTIGLNENADLSTFVHEIGHLWLEIMGDVAAMPEASQQVKDDYAAVLKWLGVESREQIETKHHELFARGNEAYLMEGNAPSPALRTVFSRIKQWMLGIYTTLTRLNVKLSAEVRDVFDRIYAAEAEIEAARREAGTMDLLIDAATAKISEAEFKAYRDLIERAAAAENDLLRARLMKEMMRGRKQWWADELERVRAEVAAEIDAQPVYQAFHDLTTKLEDGGVRLSKADLVRRYGDAYLARLPRAFARIYSVDGGVGLDALAPVYGFDSGDALIKALVEMRPRKALIAAEAAQRMRERHGDAMTNGTEMAKAVDEAIANEARADVIAIELRHANRLLRQADPARKAAKAEAREDAKQARAALDMPPTAHLRRVAEGYIGQQRIADITPHAYLMASRKANKAAFAAMANKDYAEAAAQKQKELINHFLFMEATKRLNAVEKARRRLRRLEKKEARARIGKAGNNYLEQIDALLERYELITVPTEAIKRRESLLTWAEQQTHAGNPINVPLELLDDAKKINWRQASVDEFMALVDMVKQIEHMARLKNRLLTAADKRDINAIAMEASKSIRASKKAMPKRLEPERGVVPWLRGFYLSHRKLSSLFRQMDGGNDSGVLWNLLTRGMNAAGAKEAAMIGDASEKLLEIFRPLLAMPGGINGDARYISAIGASLTRGGRLAVALNCGNETNRDRLRQGDGWNDYQVQAILSTLTKAELDAVQQTLDLIDSFWPQIAEKERRVTGVAPNKVEAVPFSVTSADGYAVQMRGGYYPIKYDAENSQQADQHEAADIAKRILAGAYSHASTKRGHVKERLQTVKRPVRKSVDVIGQHLVEVIHDLCWHEWLIDANRLIGHPDVDAAIREHYGAEAVREIKSGLVDIASGNLQQMGAVDRGLLHLRANISSATMGLSMTTSLLQPFGLLQSMVRVGVGTVVRGMARWAGDMARMENTLAEIRKKSVFMRTRAKTMNREMHEIMGRLVHGKSKARHIYEVSLFVLMQKLQLIADVPTWTGVYENALMQGKSEDEAIAQADRAVIEAQGSGMVKDLAQVQRKNPFLTMFYSYFSAAFNIAAEKTAATNFRSPAQVAGWAADMILLIVAQAIGPALVSSWLRGEKKCVDDWEECAKDLARETAGFALGLVVGAREFSGVLQGFDYAGPPVGRAVTEVSRLTERLIDGEYDDKAAQYSVRLLGSLTGIPSTQIVRSWRGWQAWEDGEAPASAVLMGPPRRD